MSRKNENENNKKPLANLEAERSLLGGMLLDPRKIQQVFDMIAQAGGSTVFFSSENREIFEAIQTAYREIGSIDLILLGDYLDRHGRFEAVGGAPYLASLEEEIVSTLYLFDYARVVIERYRQRRAMDAMQQSQSEIYHGLDITASVETSAARLSELAREITQRKPSDTSDLFIEEFCEIEARCANRKAGSGMLGLSTGFGFIDRATGGLKPRQLVVIGARTSVGKSAFAMQVAINVGLRQCLPTAIISYEMAQTELMSRMISSVSGVNLSDILKGTVNSLERDKIHNCAEAFRDSVIQIDDRIGANVEVIADRVKAHKASNRALSLVIVDYLQLIPSTGDSRHKTRQMQIGEMTRRLKILAGEIEAPIIVLAQLNRASDEKDEPEIKNLRESGDIEQDADVIILLHRAELHSDICKARIAKQRNGPVTPWVSMTFDGTRQRFFEHLQTNQDKGSGI